MIKTACSHQKSLEQIADDIKTQFAQFDPKMVLYFSSSQFDPEQTAQKIQAVFPNAVTLGCTTAGEISTGKMLKNGLSVMGFSEKTIADVKVEAVTDLHNAHSVKKSLDSLGTHYNEKLSQMDLKKYVGLILIDGLSKSEEKIMDIIGDNTDIQFVGGSAGDDLQFKGTHVFANGRAYPNAAVLALIKPAVPFDIIKTQSFNILDKKLVATKVDEDNRVVSEFNNKPAVEEYASHIGASPDRASDHFMHHPVGLIVNNEPFVRSPQKTDGSQIVFYCRIKQGMELSLLKATDIVQETQNALRKKTEQMGGLSGIVNFNCILRTLELEKNNQIQDYASIFSQVPTVGFSTYGEEYIGHINQTSTILAFGRKK